MPFSLPWYVLLAAAVRGWFTRRPGPCYASQMGSACPVCEREGRS